MYIWRFDSTTKYICFLMCDRLIWWEIPMWDFCISHHMTFLTPQCEKHCVTIHSKNKPFPPKMWNLWSIQTINYYSLCQKLFDKLVQTAFLKNFSIWLSKLYAIFTRLGLRASDFWCRLSLHLYILSSCLFSEKCEKNN